VRWGEFDSATQSHGLAATCGQVSHTGIAGLTLGGGLGYLMGKHGAACDNLLSLDVVTAGGEMLTASAEQNPDLFWAMRGAGGNCGVVTSFRYRLHRLDEMLAGMLIYPRERAASRNNVGRNTVSALSNSGSHRRSNHNPDTESSSQYPGCRGPRKPPPVSTAQVAFGSACTQRVVAPQIPSAEQ
jgi:FAD/FMN-containing dehydrogenase